MLPARFTHHPCSGAQSESSPTCAGFGGMREHPILLRFKTLTPESVFFLFLPPTCVCLQGLGALLPRPTRVPAPWVGAACWGAPCAWAALGLRRPGDPGLEDCVRSSLTRPSLLARGPPRSRPPQLPWMLSRPCTTAGSELLAGSWQPPRLLGEAGRGRGCGRLRPSAWGRQVRAPWCCFRGAFRTGRGWGLEQRGKPDHPGLAVCGGLLALHSFSLAS